MLRLVVDDPMEGKEATHCPGGDFSWLVVHQRNFTLRLKRSHRKPICPQQNYLQANVPEHLVRSEHLVASELLCLERVRSRGHFHIDQTTHHGIGALESAKPLPQAADERPHCMHSCLANNILGNRFG